MFCSLSDVASLSLAPFVSAVSPLILCLTLGWLSSLCLPHSPARNRASATLELLNADYTVVGLILESPRAAVSHPPLLHDALSFPLLQPGSLPALGIDFSFLWTLCFPGLQ